MVGVPAVYHRAAQAPVAFGGCQLQIRFVGGAARLKREARKLRDGLQWCGFGGAGEEELAHRLPPTLFALPAFVAFVAVVAFVALVAVVAVPAVAALPAEAALAADFANSTDNFGALLFISLSATDLTWLRCLPFRPTALATKAIGALANDVPPAARTSATTEITSAGETRPLLNFLMTGYLLRLMACSWMRMPAPCGLRRAGGVRIMEGWTITHGAPRSGRTGRAPHRA